MIPSRDFLGLDLEFWSNVKFISNNYGYSDRLPQGTKLKDNIGKIPLISDIKTHLEKSGVAIPKVKTVSTGDIINIYLKEKFDTSMVLNDESKPTEFCNKLSEYFNYRAETLNEVVEPLLMDADIAETEFKSLKDSFVSKLPVAMNKQKGDKKKFAYLTAIINMLVEKTLDSPRFDHNPRNLIIFTKDNSPKRVLSRTVDGAYPSIVNPKALWEIKEYYYTTTFGSRVADGVYESLLDGLELREVRQSLGNTVSHYLFVDAYYTWWIQGKSYLCRLFDMMHMGLIDEVIFGREVFDRVPEIVKSWLEYDSQTELPIAAEP